ncbi:hypothetical protein ACE5IS_02220 [Leptospira wolffii]|uniref:Uncharacterized protein n=1 Tax=Leptospira wolffii TaxID=409998 RepID=A0A2M9ZGL2_9LEPT|nr:hypothetical protein [Leptospira wolffii]EPG64423.1 hypothetical protein LEP1GSC061_3651 [Leptospira wolffii serovar Khorat str. Khorat-H2]PJZ67561.1 hypothetical protein CH371_05975 [Leptospira wolffii]TGK62568.1 hypothetical protein EHQ32_07060 [Leptospira wolffii]TGK70364.1 hypothetical protein EHQ27_12070 [Leptospira wolffii]TGK74047.1 hypothetical protein EHQ35_06710 [Leptospira wolffii]
MGEIQSKHAGSSELLEASDLKTLKDKKTSREISVLLYRVLFRSEEVRSGALKVVKETFIRTHSNHPEQFPILDRGKFVRDMISVFKTSTVLTPEKLESFFTGIHAAFQSEIRYLLGKSTQFTFDIMFQVIESILQEMSHPEDQRTVDVKDREIILKHFRAYNDLSKFFNKMGTSKAVIDKKDEIITEISIAHKEITIVSIENMFRNILAQILLSRKYNCGTLIDKWSAEYGFGPEQAQSMRNYIQQTATLTDFRTQYANALRVIGTENEMDLMFLRTLSNYYASWVTQVSEQIPA